MATPIKTGIIGFGLSGRVFHAPFLSANPDFRLELIATSDPQRRALASARYPDAQVVDSPADLLERAGDLDLVVLASPAHTHLEQGLAALKSGAAVVVDKPFAPSVAAAEVLIAAAASVRKPLIVFQNRRWDGDFLTVAKLIGSGALGTIARFESTFERWAGPLRERWQDTTTPAEGAGITFDIGSHLIDQALQLFGPVVQLHAELRIQRPGGASDDDAFVSLLHAGGVRSHLTMSSVAALSGPRFRVLGSSGTYCVTGLDPQEASVDSGMLPTDEDYGLSTPDAFGAASDGRTRSVVPTERGDYPAFYTGVAAAIRGDGPVPVDPLDALEVVRIIERIHREFPAV
ncbi:Gfo/Idh/MocA family oxidoreductase [Parafrigoribacterium mesophilum]|uniref:Gfo/Idh/MocA family protein n=1 Tax=Parafrigoribacterium mesophilum TaxID=433646 RepID=UPI0031FC8206